MLLIANVVLIGLIALLLWVAARRGRSHANRARAARARAAQADLIPARPGVRVPPRITPNGPSSPATWSASRERGDPERTVPVRPEPRRPEPRRPVPRRPVPRRPVPQPPELSEPPELSGPVVSEPVATNGEALPALSDLSARPARPAVLVVPRGSSWVVRRDGAARVSSVHATREAAEQRGRKTARRERVVLEVRDEESELLARTDYAASADAEL